MDPSSNTGINTPGVSVVRTLLKLLFVGLVYYVHYFVDDTWYELHNTWLPLFLICFYVLFIPPNQPHQVKHENHGPSSLVRVDRGAPAYRAASTRADLSCLNWEIDNESNDPVFRNLKWILTDDPHHCDQVVSFLQSVMDDKLFVGFDIEYDPCFFKGQRSRTALIQIAIHTGHCLLFQVSQLRQLPPLFTKLLADPDLVKAGVGIHEDVKKIKRDFDVEIPGWCDLSSIASSDYQMGLAALTTYHLNTVLPKSKSIIMTKWSGELSPRKQAYAARDAFVSVLLLPILVAKKLQIAESNVTQNDIVTCMKMPDTTKEEDRRNNIEIAGLTETKEEDLYRIISKIGRMVGVEIRREHLDACYRVLSPIPEKTNPIVVKFADSSKKRELLMQKPRLSTFDLQLPGPHQVIFINDHLSPNQKFWLAKARGWCKKQPPTVGASAWAADNKVFLKKSKTAEVHLIDSTKTLFSLIPKK